MNSDFDHLIFCEIKEVVGKKVREEKISTKVFVEGRRKVFTGAIL